MFGSGFGSEIERRRESATGAPTTSTGRHGEQPQSPTHRCQPTGRPIEKGALVTATITTSNKTIEIRYQGEPITHFDYPINHTITQPYYPPAAHSLLRHM